MLKALRISGIATLILAVHAFPAFGETTFNRKSKTIRKPNPSSSVRKGPAEGIRINPGGKSKETSGGDRETSGRFYLSVFYSTANKINYKGTAPSFSMMTSFTATESTSGALGVGAGYAYRSAGGLGFGAGLDFETARSSHGLVGSVSGTGFHGHYEGESSKALLTGTVNGNYSFNDKLYVSAGFNFPVILGSSSGLKVNGQLGYQAGGGWAFNDSYSLEMSYRQVRMKGSVDVPGFNLKIDEAAFPGFLVGLRYSW